MFTKAVIRQGKKIIRLNKENKALYEENKENRFELLELEDYKKKNEKLKEDGLAEYEIDESNKEVANTKEYKAEKIERSETNEKNR